MHDPNSLFYSAVSALTARMLCHPLDTLKTQIQGDLSSKGIAQTFVHLKDQGFRSFYKGLPIASVFSIPGLASYLFLYDTVKQQLETFGAVQNSVFIHALAGCIAECGSSIFWTPMEVIKNKQQYENLGLKSVVQSIYRENGVLGFTRGYLLGLCVFVPYSITYFVAYEKLKFLCLDKDNHNFWVYLGCSSLSGALAASVSNVLDLVKTRVQLSGKRASFHLKELLIKDGFKAFTKGLGVRILWITPSVSISMATYEILKKSEFTF